MVIRLPHADLVLMQRFYSYIPILFLLADSGLQDATSNEGISLLRTDSASVSRYYF
jgi:hypothetical protein